MTVAAVSAHPPQSWRMHGHAFKRHARYRYVEQMAARLHYVGMAGRHARRDTSTACMRLATRERVEPLAHASRDQEDRGRNWKHGGRERTQHEQCTQDW